MNKAVTLGGEIASTRKFSVEEYLDSITFEEDDFEFDNSEFISRIDADYISRSHWKDALIRFRKNKGAVFSVICILVIILFAVFGPMMSGYTYDQQDINNQNMAPRIPVIENTGFFDGSEKMLSSTGTKLVNKYTKDKIDIFYWFGSDSLGRDIWTRTWIGTRISLFIALIAVFIDMVLGLSYGLISGYFGGRVDMVMQRIVEVVNSIPTLVVVTLLMIILQPGLSSIILSLIITGWIGMSRIARAEMLKLKEEEFVLASRTLGAKSFRIIFKEIFPNIFGQLITQTMFSIPHAIFTEAFLAFIGLGVPQPMASLGSMISDGYKNFTTHPYMIISPLIVMALLMLCFTMFADGLRDALDPKMKEG